MDWFGDMHKSSPIKVALFLDNRGNRRHHIQCKALAEAGFDVKLIVFKDFPENHYLIKKGHKNKFIYLTKTRNEGFRKFSFSLLAELIKLIKKENIRVILTHRWKLVKYLFLGKFFCPELKIIYHIVIGGRFSSFKRRFFFKLVEPKIDLIVVNSLALKEELIKHNITSPKKIELLYSSLDFSEFDLKISKSEIRKKLNLPEKEFLFGMIANFRKEKDQMGLIRAFYHFLKEGGEAKLILVGNGANLEKCKNLVDELKIKDSVIFPGRIPLEEVPLWLKSFDVFVYATFKEGMPMAVLEAMAAELPIIATDAEGLPDIFDTDLSLGYLVPKKNYTALTEALWKIYKLSEEEREKMGKNAKKRFLEAFSPENLAKNTLNIFKNLASS